MLIVNGHIKLQKASGGGMVDGIPIPITNTWSENIECQYRANKYSNLGVVSGNAFTQHEYEILVEDNAYTRLLFSAYLGLLTESGDSIELESGESIDLSGERTEKLSLESDQFFHIGDFPIIRADKLPHVDLIKIKI